MTGFEAEVQGKGGEYNAIQLSIAEYTMAMQVSLRTFNSSKGVCSLTSSLTESNQVEGAEVNGVHMEVQLTGACLAPRVNETPHIPPCDERAAWLRHTPAAAALSCLPLSIWFRQRSEGSNSRKGRTG